MRLRNKKGTAVVEAALMLPWLAFLFVGVLDFGFFAYAGTCTQNAARAGAFVAANGSFSQSAACNSVLAEIKTLPNAPGLSSCNALPLIVSIQKLCAAGATDPTCAASPACADCGQDAVAQSAQVSVTYQSVPMIPIPGVLTGQLTLTRIAEVRILQ